MDTESSITSKAGVTRSANTRMTGKWHLIVRTAWLILVVPILGLYICSLVLYAQQLQQGCVDLAMCRLGEVAFANLFQAFSTLGLPTGVYIALVMTANVLVASVWCGTGLIIFWRRSDDWLALLAAFALILFYLTSSGSSLLFVTVALPDFTFFLELLTLLGELALNLLFVFFPDGRLRPRWMRLLLGILVLQTVLSNTEAEASWPNWVLLVVNLGIYGTIVFSQIYRYRRISTPIQRQQTKWVVFGMSLFVAVLILLLVIAALNPALSDTPFWNGVWEVVFPSALLLIPLSIGFSILRYRLYDIDVLINRTLVYSSLTALLALLYFGLVIGLQALVHLAAYQAGDPAIVVISTLVIAALFQPLRKRVQTIIDRRFYRSKYDATRIVATFSATLSTEVNLGQLSEHLLAVVQETMQPASLSLWLREDVRKNNAQGGETE